MPHNGKFNNIIYMMTEIIYYENPRVKQKKTVQKYLS